MNKFINMFSKMKRPSLLGLSIATLLFIGFVDWITGTDLSISVFYLIPIAISSWFINKWSGLILAFLSAIVWFLSDFMDSVSYAHPITPYWNSIVMLGTFIAFTLLLSKLKSVLDLENSLALDIQRNLLPNESPQISGYTIFSIWQPTTNVSGDYFDFINHSNNLLGVSLADVCGHGYPAALLMSNLQASFRIIANNNPAPQTVCNQLNSIICRYAMPEKFTSFFYGILDAEKKQFTYSNAGHPSPIILRSKSEICHLESGGLLLGISSDAEYKQSMVQLEKDDILFLYTDGIIETRNKSGEEFGENRLIEFCKRNIYLQVKDFSKEILNTLKVYSDDNIDDDITLVVISVN